MATNDGRITQQSDPDIWAKLMELRAQERGPTGQYPGWITKGSLNYRVIQQADQSIAFLPQSTENLYESTSF
jgi:hypothetical protein